LYAFGGRTTAGAFLNSYEFATLTVAPDGGQTVSAWTAGTRTLGTAKAELGAWVITADDTSLVPATDARIFVGTGRTSSNNDTGEIRSGLVSASGDLTAVSGAILDAENGAGAGTASAYAEGGGFLYLFGGERGNTSNTVATDSSSSVTAGPDLSNWNSLAGGSLITRRSFAACAQESAFYYVAGGKSNSTAALSSVEQTVQ
jgi:hypothetical protein